MPLPARPGFFFWPQAQDFFREFDPKCWTRSFNARFFRRLNGVTKPNLKGEAKMTTYPQKNKPGHLSFFSLPGHGLWAEWGPRASSNENRFSALFSQAGRGNECIEPQLNGASTQRQRMSSCLGGKPTMGRAGVQQPRLNPRRPS